MRHSAARICLCLGLSAGAACSSSSNKPREADAEATASSEAGPGGGAPEDGGAHQEPDASSMSPHDGGAQPTDAGGNASDGASQEARDSATDANRDAASPTPKRTFVYVGGYSDSDGLHVYELNRATFALSPVAQKAEVGPRPSYITPSADGRTLYVANESESSAGITVLRVDPMTGVPSRIDHENAITSSFVFSALSPDGRYLLAASYNGGNVAVYPVKSDGALDPRVDAREFGANAQAHSVRVHASGKWVYVPTKGLNSVAQLTFDATSGKLADNPKAPTFPAPGGATDFAGPRHIAFSADGKFAFVILELGDDLISLAVQSDGTLRELDRQKRAPANAGDSDTGAHVLAHPNARFVYGSNRGSDTLVAFSYDEQGKLGLIGHVPSRGATPRNFDIDSLGKVLIVANQGADNGSGGSLAVFAIEGNGSLTAKGSLVTGLTSPVAVAIVSP